MKNAVAVRKLSLSRETLAPLVQSDLEDVNGGTGWACRATYRVSVWTVKATEQVLESVRYSCFC